MNFYSSRMDLPGAIDIDLGQPKIEIRIIGNSVYVLATGLNNIGFFDLSQIDGQWVEFESPTLQSEFQAGLNESGIEDTQEGEAFFDQLETVEELGTEKIRGDQAYHYKVVPKENLTDGLNWSSASLEIWIGVDDFLLRKIILAGDMAELDDSGETKEGTITIEFELFDYGRDVDIDVPSDARPFEELLGLIGA
jgi:hypothetical protein